MATKITNIYPKKAGKYAWISNDGFIIEQNRVILDRHAEVLLVRVEETSAAGRYCRALRQGGHIMCGFASFSGIYMPLEESDGWDAERRSLADYSRLAVRTQMQRWLQERHMPGQRERLAAKAREIRQRLESKGWSIEVFGPEKHLYRARASDYLT